MGYIRSLRENADILRSPSEIQVGSKLPSCWPFQVVFSLVEYTQGTDSSVTLQEGLLARQLSQSEHRGFVFGFWLYKTTQRTRFKRKKLKKKKAKTRCALSSLSTLGWRRVWSSDLSPSPTLWSSYMTCPVTIPRVINWFTVAWGFPGFSTGNCTSRESTQCWANPDSWSP